MFIIQAGVTRKRINLHQRFFMDNREKKSKNLTSVFNFLKIKTINLFSSLKSVKLLSVLRICSSWLLSHQNNGRTSLISLNYRIRIFAFLSYHFKQ